MVLQKSPDELLDKPKAKENSILEKLNVKLGTVNMLIHRNNEMLLDPALTDMAEIKEQPCQTEHTENAVKGSNSS